MRPAASSAYRLTPPVAVLAAAWSLYMVASGRLLEASVLAVALASASGLLDRAPMLYLWLAAPSLAVVSAFYGLEEGVEASARIAVAALASSGSLASVSYLEAYAWLRAAGLPPHWALMPALVARQAQVALSSLAEARAALKGRGLSGLRLAYTLPIPVLVHMYRYSASLAESLNQRGAIKPTPVRVKPRLTLGDAVVLAYIVLTTLAALAGNRPS